MRLSRLWQSFGGGGASVTQGNSRCGYPAGNPTAFIDMPEVRRWASRQDSDILVLSVYV